MCCYGNQKVIISYLCDAIQLSAVPNRCGSIVCPNGKKLRLKENLLLFMVLTFHSKTYFVFSWLVLDSILLQKFYDSFKHYSFVLLSGVNVPC